MVVKTFIPDDQYLDNLVKSIKNQYINLDLTDIVNIKKCKDILVYEASKDQTFEGDCDKFIESFFGEVRNLHNAKGADHVVICIAFDISDPLTMESMSHIHDFCEIFDENTEVRWGMSQNEDKVPMNIVVAIGKCRKLERQEIALVDTPEVGIINKYDACQQNYSGDVHLPPIPMDGDDTETPNIALLCLDPMFEEVARMIVQTRQGSISKIQRKFYIGYNRACRLMNQLEVAGIVGSAHGSKPREVLCISEKDLQIRLDNLKELLKECH